MNAAPITATRRGTPWACLVAALERTHGSAAKRARRYFARIEATFDTHHVPYSDVRVPGTSRHEWISAILELMAVLSERLRRRAWGAGGALPALTLGQRRTVRLTARLLRSIASASFDAFDDWRAAMERYANGELRYAYAVARHDGPDERYVACEPDSSFHALWAEFALLALEIDADAAHFRAALPTLVATMQIYGAVYANHAATTPALGARGRYDAARRLAPAKQRRVREEYAALPFDALLARHAALARRYCFPPASER